MNVVQAAKIIPFEAVYVLSFENVLYRALRLCTPVYVSHKSKSAHGAHETIIIKETNKEKVASYLVFVVYPCSFINE